MNYFMTLHQLQLLLVFLYSTWEGRIVASFQGNVLELAWKN